MKRMKTIATSLFVLALVGALAAWPFRDYFIGGLLFAACEAALVGALADWFAVVALFRHPLGLKFIPHTAIIPSNRERIIEGITAIVEKDWLSLDFIQAKIMAYPVIDRLAAYLATVAGREEFAKLTQSACIHLLKEMDPEEIARFMQAWVKDYLPKNAVPRDFIERLAAWGKTLFADALLQFFLRWAIGASQGRQMELTLAQILQNAAADYSQQGNVFRKLSKGLGEGLHILHYEEAAHALAENIRQMLVEMQNTAHPYYRKAKEELQRLKITDADTTAFDFNQILLAMIRSEGAWQAAASLLAQGKAQLLAAAEAQPSWGRLLADMVVERVQAIQRDAKRKAALEGQMKNALANLLTRYHGVIGEIVREKLAGLDDRGLVLSLEDKVGDDLQWIRINGTVIGALVGILQYLLLHWL